MGNTVGTRWRGKLPIPAHVHPLMRRLFCELNAQRTTITEAAGRSGLRRETISDWRYRQEPRLSDFNAVLNAIGLELCIREIKE